MLAFVLAGVLVAASGSDSADLQQNAAQNPPAQTESVSAAIPGIGTVVELKARQPLNPKTEARVNSRKVTLFTWTKPSKQILIPHFKLN